MTSCQIPAVFTDSSDQHGGRNASPFSRLAEADACAGQLVPVPEDSVDTGDTIAIVYGPGSIGTDAETEEHRIIFATVVGRVIKVCRSEFPHHLASAGIDFYGETLQRSIHGDGIDIISRFNALVKEHITADLFADLRVSDSIASSVSRILEESASETLEEFKALSREHGIGSSKDCWNDPLLSVSTPTSVAQASCSNASSHISLAAEWVDTKSVAASPSSDVTLTDVALDREVSEASLALTPRSMVMRDSREGLPSAANNSSPLNVLGTELATEASLGGKAQLRAALEAQMHAEKQKLSRLNDMLQALDAEQGEQCNQEETRIPHDGKPVECSQPEKQTPQDRKAVITTPPGKPTSPIPSAPSSKRLSSPPSKRVINCSRTSSSSPSRPTRSQAKPSRSQNSTPRSGNTRHDIYGASIRQGLPEDREYSTTPASRRCLSPDSTSMSLTRASSKGDFCRAPRFPWHRDSVTPTRQRDPVTPRQKRPNLNVQSNRAVSSSTAGTSSSSTGTARMEDLCSLLATIQAQVNEISVEGSSSNSTSSKEDTVNKWASVSAACEELEKLLAHARSNKASAEEGGRTTPQHQRFAKMTPSVTDFFAGSHSHRRSTDGSRTALGTPCGSRTIYPGKDSSASLVRKDSKASLCRDSSKASLIRDLSRSSLGSSASPCKNHQGFAIHEHEAQFPANKKHSPRGNQADVLNSLGMLIASNTNEPLEVVLERISQRISHHSQQAPEELSPRRSQSPRDRSSPQSGRC